MHNIQKKSLNIISAGKIPTDNAVNFLDLYRYMKQNCKTFRENEHQFEEIKPMY